MLLCGFGPFLVGYLDNVFKVLFWDTNALLLLREAAVGGGVEMRQVAGEA